MPSTALADRSLIEVKGADARSFLQGLITCDMDKVSPQQAGFGALLTPQGKIITDFVVLEQGESFFLDTPSSQVADLMKRLTLYKLRAQVSVTERPDLAVAAIWDEAHPAAAYADPRSNELGARVICARSAVDGYGENGPLYEARRIAAGIPKGGVDFIYGDAFPHDANMDLIHGVDFRKGCYVGQEVVSRVQHRGTARRRILRVTLNGAAPAHGTAILAGDAEIGTLGSSAGQVALASLRVDKLEDARKAGVPVTAANAVLLP